MKNVFIIVGLSALIISCGENNISQTIDGSDVKFGFYIKDSIPEHFTFYMNAQKQLDEKGRAYEERLYNLQTKGQQMLANYQKQVGAGLLSNNQIARKEQEIQLVQQQIQILQETDGADLNREGNDMTIQVVDKMSKYGKEYAQNNGISVFLGAEQGGGVLYMDSTMDVTMDFIDYMNKQELADK
jgi:outer membrane protein